LIQEEEIEYPALDEEEESAEKTEPGEGERGDPALERSSYRFSNSARLKVKVVQQRLAEDRCCDSISRERKII
jgi:hypothetical protein